MHGNPAEVVVAGHICLDVIPLFGERESAASVTLAPGTLTTVGPAITATGGPVSNTGLALHRLGIPTKLMGKVGDDLFGHAILDLLRESDPALAEGMIVEAGETTSYSIVVSPPGIDRFFLHSPGANNTFCADDVDMGELSEARLFHFGYPPLMRRMYANEGAELAALMARVKAAGVTTSLDMAYPDPDSEAGRADWTAILRRVLPHVDVFLPSLDEILFMLDRPRFDRLHREAPGELAAHADGALLGEIAGQLIEMGVALAVLKLGNQGLYIRTTGSPARLQAMGRCAPRKLDGWLSRELLSPCFKTKVVGTTGAGDSTIAGFLAGLLKGLPIEQVMTGAVAVGAFNVESADATSGIRDWRTVQARLRAGWERLPVSLNLPGWQWDDEPGIWISPHDARRAQVRSR